MKARKGIQFPKMQSSFTITLSMKTKEDVGIHIIRDSINKFKK